jgi:uncharacterized protein (TIGR03435 family)
MVQSLLEDRFQLKAHLESREVPFYNLVVGKDGPKPKARRISLPLLLLELTCRSCVRRHQRNRSLQRHAPHLSIPRKCGFLEHAIRSRFSDGNGQRGVD